PSACCASSAASRMAQWTHLLCLESSRVGHVLPPPFPYTTLFRSVAGALDDHRGSCGNLGEHAPGELGEGGQQQLLASLAKLTGRDRKSTRLNSSHAKNSYAAFSLKKKHNRAPAPGVSGIDGGRSG